MAKSSFSFSDPFADVETAAVQVAGEDVAKVAVRVKDDKGEYQLAGILGKDYQVYKNSLVRDVVHDIMSRSQMSWKSLKTLWNGKQYVDYFYTENPITAIKNGMEYPLHLGMMARNSYDGSSKFGLEFYIMNMVCTNQYIARKAMGYFAVRHTGENNFDVQDALDNISQGTSRLISLAPKIQGLIEKKLELSDIVAAQAAEVIPSSHWGTAIETLGKEYDMGTIFGLYQALTFVTSHKMSGLSSISKGDEVTNYIFNKY